VSIQLYDSVPVNQCSIVAVGLVIDQDIEQRRTDAKADYGKGHR
jgi:hypothetical protein